MVCSGGVELVRYLSASTIRELVGVYLESQTEFQGFPKNPARLERIKRSLLAKHITELG